MCALLIVRIWEAAELSRRSVMNENKVKWQTVEGVMDALDYGDRGNVVWHLREGEDALAQQVLFELGGLKTEFVCGGNLGLIIVSL